GRIAMAKHFDPAPFFKGLDDLRRNRHAPDVFDVAARDRLTPSYDGQGFEHSARVTRRLLRIEALEIALHFGTALESPAAGQPDQLEPFVGPRVLQGLQMLIHLAAVGRRIAKEPFQLVDRHRLVGTQQGRFKYSYYLCFCHQVAGRLSRRICIAGIIALIFCFPDAGWSSLAARRAHNPKVVGVEHVTDTSIYTS